MILGSHTVVLREFTQGAGRGRLNQRQVTSTNNTVTGCLMRPSRPKEVVTLTDIATDVWRCVAPPVVAALNATAAGELDYDGRTYQIIAVEPFADFGGALSHVTITCQRQTK